MGVRTDYANATVVIERDDKVIKTYNFKEFVSARQFQPVNKLRNELIEASQKKTPPKNLEQLNIDFFNRVTEVALKEKLDYDKACDIMTAAEIGNFAEELLIFLVNWSSTEAVKLFAKQYQATEKKEAEP